MFYTAVFRMRALAIVFLFCEMGRVFHHNTGNYYSY